MIAGGKHPDFPIDWNDLFDRIGDEEIILEFALSFVRNGEKLIGSLGQAVTGGDPEQIELYAHALKGSASNIGAVPLAKVAWQLEKIAAEKHVEKAAEWFEKICPAFQTLKSLLEQPDWMQQTKNAALVKAL
ncbi:MAG: Hpt domain-containing protein [Phycisphaerae bacterium]|nr:Hpt domain-containing protein [Phycisphaerae bacterium]